MVIFYTKLLNLIGILIVASVVSCKLIEAFDEYDDALQEALFLVQLLKLNSSHIMRSQANGDAENGIDEENSTCSIPPDDFNSTMAVNETDVSVSGGSTIAVLMPPSSPTPMASTPVMPPAAPYFFQTPWAPIVTPYPNWNPNMGYPAGPGQQKFPDENNRLPYRYNRRMRPDYYYFENFRRQNDPIDGPPAAQEMLRLFKETPTVRPRPDKTTLSKPDSSSQEETTVSSQEETTASLAAETSPETTLRVEDIPTTTTSTTIAQPSELNLPTAKSTKQPIQSTTESAKHTNKPYQGSENGNTVKDGKHLTRRIRLKKVQDVTTTTMKIFLRGSSRIPLPFPKNNAFCHYHPESPLCRGAM